MAVFKVEVDGHERLARGPAEGRPIALLPPDVTIDGLLAAGDDALSTVVRGRDDGPVPETARLLAPIGSQEIWAAGVTYRRSREARMEESEVPDHYARVYDADRPELFLKATPGRARGPGDPVGIRADSGWDVPEPEVGLVLDASGRLAGYVIGNDVSSRSIEGENPLYLPQAKIYDGSCAIGPGLVPLDEAPSLQDMRIALRVTRQGRAIFTDQVDVSELHRTPAELAEWLFRASSFPVGVVLLTGTSIVPDPGFSLMAGDQVEIALPGVGVLRNGVEVVGGGSAEAGEASAGPRR